MLWFHGGRDWPDDMPATLAEPSRELSCGARLMPVPIFMAASALAAAAWLYLLAWHGQYWRTDQRLPALQAGGPPPAWPSVVAVVPARNDAAVLPETLPTLLGQNYP